MFKPTAEPFSQPSAPLDVPGKDVRPARDVIVSLGGWRWRGRGNINSLSYKYFVKFLRSELDAT